MLVAHFARWLLPWGCVVFVSASIAHATGDALSRVLVEAPEPSVVASHAACQQACPHWVDLLSLDELGHDVRVRCLARDGRYAGDVMLLHYDDLGMVIADMCSELSAIPAG